MHRHEFLLTNHYNPGIFHVTAYTCALSILIATGESTISWYHNLWHSYWWAFTLFPVFWYVNNTAVNILAYLSKCFSLLEAKAKRLIWSNYGKKVPQNFLKDFYKRNEMSIFNMNIEVKYFWNIKYTYIRYWKHCIYI